MNSRSNTLFFIIFSLISLNTNAEADQTDHLRYLIESSLRPAAELTSGRSMEQHAQHRGDSLPADTTILRLQVRNNNADVCLRVSQDFLRDRFDDLALEKLGHQVEDWLRSLQDVTSFRLQLSPDGEAECRDAPRFLNTINQEPADKVEPGEAPLPASPWLKKPDESSRTHDDSQRWQPMTLALARGQGQPTGALSGASIFLSPGHGWYYNDSLGRYATQRGNTHNLIEDLSNAEAVLQYLVPYLWNAGARVYTTRERDLNTHMIVLDNEDPDVIYQGDGWSTLSNSLNWQGNHREIATTEGEATASASFIPNIRESGYYGVYVWYGRASDGNTHRSARFRINHSGGSTDWKQDLSQDGNTWKYIGRYHFEAGTV